MTAIKMKKDYKGPLGTFEKDKEYPLPSGMAKYLPADSWEQVPAGDDTQTQGVVASKEQVPAGDDTQAQGVVASKPKKKDAK